MIIYGVGLLAFCYLFGQLFGEILGKVLGINANIGGVGFAMLLLMIMQDWFKKNQWLSPSLESGIQFWNKMYIPIIIAMAATQNVKLALSSGLITFLVGVIPVILCFGCIPFLAKFIRKSETDILTSPEK